MTTKPVLPEVIVDGRPMPAERVDPSVISFVMQAAAAAQLVKLRRLEESKVPTGAKSYKWTVGTTIMEVPLGRPWISFTIINGGAGSVYFRVNSEEGPLTDEAEVQNGETKNMDFTYPVVTKLFFRTDTGTATIRVWGVEGKWNSRKEVPK